MTGPILIIEDDPDIAEVLSYAFARTDLETRVALSGEEGLSLCLDKHNPPAIILLDLLLPGMSGFELCRRLRNEPLTRKTPIVLVTAKVSDKDVAMGMELGVDDYIAKPFSVREVIGRVSSLLQARTAFSAEIRPPQPK
jgi:DNA-binding response OmpR family regulator